MSLKYVCAGVLMSANVFAQVERPNQDSDHSLSIGLAGVTVESIYVDGDRQNRAFPAVNYAYKQFYFQAGDLGFHLFENENWELDIGIGANLAGDVDRGDSELLEDLPDLSIPVSAFVSAQYTSSIGLFEVAYQEEINNKHNGNSAAFSYTVPFPVGKWLLLPRLEANYFSEEAVNYFYGVEPDFALAGRPAYTADSEIVLGASVFALRRINDKFSIFANVNYQDFGDEITNSPIVEDDSAVSVFAGFLYKIF
ncbi:MipA/OmpV family protein [Marinicella sp. W31]|uniref:MipA/OmpV family protein n=1 Tax=Marinicella sp. W31 TaxID=3023713 RepID=UPI0037581FAF